MSEPGEPFYIVLKPYSWPYSNEIPSLLGRIVKNFYSPFDQYTPPAQEHYPSRKLVISGPLKDFRLSIDQRRELDASGEIHKLGDVSGGFWKSVETELAGTSVWAVRLQQLDDTFRALTANPSINSTVCEWLGPLRAGKAYFIAGVLVAENATMALSSNTGRSATVGMSAPIVTMAQLAAGSPITLPVGDIGANAKVGESTLASFRGRIEGKRIIAIDCRVVRHRRFQSQVKLTEQNPSGVPQARRFAGGDDEGEIVLEKTVDERHARHIGSIGSMAEASLCHLLVPGFQGFLDGTGSVQGGSV